MANYSKEFLVACTTVDIEQLTFDELKQLITILHTNIYGLPEVQSDTSSDTLCDDCQCRCQCTPSESVSDDKSDNELHGPSASVVDAHTDAQSNDLPDASSNTQPATQVDDRPADQEPDTQPQPKISSSPQPNVNLEQLAASFTELRTVLNNQVNSASQCSQWAPVYTQLAALTELLRSKFATWETHSEGVVGQGGTANTSGAHHHEAGSGGDALGLDIVSTSTTKKQKRKKKSYKPKNKAKEGANTDNVEDHDEETEEVQDEDNGGEEDDEDHNGEEDTEDHDGEEDDEEKGLQESERGNEHSWADEVGMSNGGTHEWGVGDDATGPWQTVTRKKKAWKKTG